MISPTPARVNTFLSIQKSRKKGLWRGRPRPRLRPAKESIQEIHSHDVHPSQTKNTALYKLQALAGEGARPTLMPTTPLAKYRYRRRLPHLQRADADIFITFCTARWQLPDPARDLILDHCLREAGVARASVARAPSPANCPKPRIHLHAAVIMPDHVHLLLLPLRDKDGWPYPLVDILQCLKSITAHQINKLLHRSGPVWEEESFDHVLRSDETLKQKVEYLRQNPARRSLVRIPENYPWLWVNPS
jgi:REP element-mobilizing transposase RayT